MHLSVTILLYSSSALACYVLSFTSTSAKSSMLCEQGLLNAVNQVFPNCHQRFCLRHLYANFQNAGFRGEDLKKCMDNASYAYNQYKFDIAMNDLKNESEEAWKWLSGIPARFWARHAFDTNCKTDLVVNNLSEVFNKYILDFRKKTYYDYG